MLQADTNNLMVIRDQNFHAISVLVNVLPLALALANGLSDHTQDRRLCMRRQFGPMGKDEG